jgi:hypothetical protein
LEIAVSAIEVEITRSASQAILILKKTTPTPQKWTVLVTDQMINMA